MIAWIKSLGGWLIGAVVIALGIFAIQRAKAANNASAKAERNAKFLDDNRVEISGALEKAEVQREIASAHADKSVAIKAQAIERLNDLEKNRGSSTARDLADRLSRL